MLSHFFAPAAVLSFLLCAFILPPNAFAQAPRAEPGTERPEDGGAAGPGGDAKLYKRALEEGRKAQKAGQLPEAERQFRAAVHEAGGFSPTDKRLLESRQGWAEVLMMQRQFGRAQRVYEDIVTFRQRAYGSTQDSLIEAWADVARAAGWAGHFDDSEKAWSRAKDMIEQRGGANHLALGTIWAGIANTYSMAGKAERAEPAFRKAIQLLEMRRTTLEHGFDGEVRRMEQKPNYVGVAGVLNDQALFFESQRRYPEAESSFLSSLSTYEREVGKKSEGVAMVTYNLGRLYRLQKQPAEAETMLKRSLAIREKMLGPKHLIVGDTLQVLADVYQDQGKTAEAARLRERFNKIRNESIRGAP